jgi:septal ring factor EnvC (AmiA/AmiB activator)
MKEVDLREAEILRVKKLLEVKSTDCTMLQA